MADIGTWQTLADTGTWQTLADTGTWQTLADTGRHWQLGSVQMSLMAGAHQMLLSVLLSQDWAQLTTAHHKRLPDVEHGVQSQGGEEGDKVLYYHHTAEDTSHTAQHL